MRAVQSAQLQKSSGKINAFFSAYPNMSDAFSHAKKLADFSLQNVSYDNDEQFFASVSSVCGVIASIIARPHVSTKREEIVTRIEQAKSLSPDDFARVCRDSSLWKRRQTRMIPEEIYYFQHTDELAIYENKFIVTLINLLDRELLKYKRFYAEELPLITGDETELVADRVTTALVLVDKLVKRIAFLKETYFYKIISASKPLSGKIKPTNILIKDGKYRICYRFYNDFIRYGADEAQNDLVSFYAVNVLKSLRLMGAKLFSDGIKVKGFKINMSLCRGAFTLEVTDPVTAITAKHLLTAVQPQEGEYDTVTIADVWNFTSVGGKRLFKNGLTESELAQKWLDMTLKTVLVSGDAYKKYCPVCGFASLYGETIIVCDHCGCKFTRTQRKSKAALWLIRPRSKQ